MANVWEAPPFARVSRARLPAFSPRWLVLPGLLAGIAAFAAWNVLASLDGSAIDETRIRMLQVEGDLVIYAARHHGAWPSSLADVDRPRDAWGRPLLYGMVGGHPRLVSWGADGVPGGEGENADLHSGQE